MATLGRPSTAVSPTYRCHGRVKHSLDIAMFSFTPPNYCRKELYGMYIEGNGTASEAVISGCAQILVQGMMYPTINLGINTCLLCNVQESSQT